MSSNKVSHNGDTDIGSDSFGGFLDGESMFVCMVFDIHNAHTGAGLC